MSQKPSVALDGTPTFLPIASLRDLCLRLKARGMVFAFFGTCRQVGEDVVRDHLRGPNCKDEK